MKPLRDAIPANTFPGPGPLLEMSSGKTVRMRGLWPAAIAVAVIVAGCSPAAQAPSQLPSAEPVETPAPTRTPQPTPALPPEVQAVIPFEAAGYGVYGVLGFDDSVWVEADEKGEPRLYRLDPASDTVTHTIEGAFPQRIGDDLWFLVDDDELVQADPDTGAQITRHRMPQRGFWTVHDGALWVIGLAETSLLVQADLVTGEVAAEFDVPPGEVKAMVAYEGGMWLAIDGSDVLVRIDLATGEMATVDPGSRPHSIATGFGSVWVTNHGETSVARVDATTATLTAKITGVGSNVAITVTDDSIWAATPSGIAEVDPLTNEIVQQIELGPADYYAVAHVAGSLWLSQANAGRVLRITAS